MKNGELSKKHSEHPGANSPRIPNRDFVVAGDLTGDGVDELAAVFYCDKGGVSWPAQIQLFESTVDGIAALGQPFGIGTISGGARGMPSGFKYANGRLSLSGPQVLLSDNAISPSGKFAASLAWNGKELVTSSFADTTHGSSKLLETSSINGTWCLVESSTGAGKNCLEISFPTVSSGDHDPRTFSIQVDGDLLNMSTYDAPLGIFYPAKTSVDDKSYPEVAKKNINEDRIYNGQTRELYVRSGS
ncbi:hypothetical protein CQ018_12375 [Arthrobacter sp. MYb227]|uniref:hypothetical protein n=1 Tax=Arthrobacter sp. MYb227 TaxID=1848601 RepID=UPI000D44D6F6|nr:hypothetical protein [Arthrobacter sp. MYb227]PQZ92293.1 hypothetical protein CQ018_12375 [Arthrobacter sp. MYb227]